jgi:hypothetical protein
VNSNDKIPIASLLVSNDYPQQTKSSYFFYSFACRTASTVDGPAKLIEIGSKKDVICLRSACKIVNVERKESVEKEG